MTPQEKYSAALAGKTLAQALALFKSPDFWAANPVMNVQNAAMTLNNVYRPAGENGWGFSNPTQGATWAAINAAMKKGNPAGYNWLVAQGNAGGFFSDLSTGLQATVLNFAPGGFVLAPLASKKAQASQEVGLQIVSNVAALAGGAAAVINSAAMTPAAAGASSMPVAAAPVSGAAATSAATVGTTATGTSVAGVVATAKAAVTSVAGVVATAKAAVGLTSKPTQSVATAPTVTSAPSSALSPAKAGLWLTAAVAVLQFL